MRTLNPFKISSDLGLESMGNSCNQYKIKTIFNEVKEKNGPKNIGSA